MRRIMVPVLAAGLSLGLAGGPARADDGVKAVITKAIAAHGGAEKLDKLKAGKMETKGTLTVAGMEIAVTGVTTFQLPGKIRQNLDVEVAGMKFEVKLVVNGDKALLMANGMKPEVTDAQLKEFKQAAFMLSVQHLTPLLADKSITLKALGEKKVDGKTLTGVEVSAKGFRDVKVYFDKETGLLTRIERVSYDQNTMQDTPQEETFSNFKDFDGVKRFTKLVVTREGQKYLESEVTSFKALDTVDAKEFSTDD